MKHLLKDFSIFGIMLALIVALFISQSHSMSEKSPEPAVKKSPASDFTLTDLSGSPVTLSKIRGTVVFLNFFATWCPPCRSEMPSIQELHEKMKGRKFAVVAVSVDRGGKSAVTPMFKNGGYTFKCLLDSNGEISEKYGVVSIPTTFIIDKEGNIVRKIIGAKDWSDAKFLEIIELLLKK